MASLMANVTVNFVSRVEMAVQLLIEKNVMHLKSGVHTAEATWADIIPHMAKELKELNVALAELPPEQARKKQWQHPNVEEELADIYGILVHAILKAGYSMQQIEDRCLLKFTERFEHVTLSYGCGDTPHLVYDAGSSVIAEVRPEGEDQSCCPKESRRKEA